MKDSENEKGVEVMEFFKFLALCHSAVIEKQPNGSLRYSSESPDEIALIKAAS